MNKKIIAIFALIVITIIAILLVGAYGNPNEFFTYEELISDTNAQSIELNITINPGDKNYTITSVDIGDNYTVVRFDSSNLIIGMELYQNDKKLEFVRAAHTSYAGSAIAFEPVNKTDKLELRVYKLKRSEDVVLTYPLEFNGDTAIINDTINGVDGHIEIKIEEKNVRVEFFNGINDIIKAEVNGFPKTPGKHVLLYKGEDIGALGDVSYFEYPPDEIKIYATIVELDDEQIIIPVN